jgi:hypothetical protein
MERHKWRVNRSTDSGCHLAFIGADGGCMPRHETESQQREGRDDHRFMRAGRSIASVLQLLEQLLSIANPAPGAGAVRMAARLVWCRRDQRAKG